jgi:hypothetical protein
MHHAESLPQWQCHKVVQAAQIEIINDQHVPDGGAILTLTAAHRQGGCHLWSPAHGARGRLLRRLRGRLRLVFTAGRLRGRLHPDPPKEHDSMSDTNNRPNKDGSMRGDTRTCRIAARPPAWTPAPTRPRWHERRSRVRHQPHRPHQRRHPVDPPRVPERRPDVRRPTTPTTSAATPEDPNTPRQHESGPQADLRPNRTATAKAATTSRTASFFNADGKLWRDPKRRSRRREAPSARKPKKAEAARLAAEAEAAAAEGRSGGDPQLAKQLGG